MYSKGYIFIVLLIGFFSCKIGFSSSKSRLFVVQEKKLNDKKSIYWFREERQITHEGLSYFQITDDKCKLSTKEANAYCSMPTQIYAIKGDTIFILSHSEVIPMKPDTQFHIQTVNYSIGLYDVNKRPDKSRQYFLDSICSERKK